MRPPIRHVLLALALTAGTVLSSGGSAEALAWEATPFAGSAAGSTSTGVPAPTESSATPEAVTPQPPVSQPPAPQPPVSQPPVSQPPADVPSGQLPMHGFTPTGQTPVVSATITTAAKVSAPVYGPATISGSIGIPMGGVAVIAEQNTGGTWTSIGSAKSNADGSFRISTTAGDARLGTIQVRLRVGDAVVSASSTPVVSLTRGFSDPHQQLSDSQVRALFRNHNIPWYSSGSCTTRSNPRCTSFDQMRAATVTETITLQQRSKCSLLVTGGTEVGHANGTYSHYNGYKIDLQMGSCVTNWVARNGSSIGGSKYAVGKAIYYNESSHWDVQVRP